MSLYPLTFQPIFKERVWGGRRLAELFQKNLPAGAVIGESWEITDRPEGVSVIAQGPLAGKDLRWLMTEHGREVLGREVAPGERFPWLIKLLDAQDDLSLQVHPPASRAAELKGEPKTELWYFADAQPGAKIYVGLRPGVDREELVHRIADGSVANCFHVHETQRGDVMFVPSGRVHALGGGNVVFEIQQNSDTTYRVFDWNRVGLDGRPRELHLEASLASIDFTDFQPALVDSPRKRQGSGERRALVDHPLFQIDEVRLACGQKLPDVRPANRPAILGVVQGGLTVVGGGETVSVRAGGFVLLPAALSNVEIRTDEASILLRVTPPDEPS